MAITRTVSDLQRNITEIYELCKDNKEPVFITRNGKPDLAIMDAQLYNDYLEYRRQVYEYDCHIRDLAIKGWEDYKAGRTTPLEEALEKMGWVEE